MALNPGDSGCTQGLSSLIYSYWTGDAANGFSSPFSTAQTALLKSMCYQWALAIANESASDGIAGFLSDTTGASHANYYAPICACTITSQYDQKTAVILLAHHGESGDASSSKHGIVYLRVKQQAALGGAPVIEVISGAGSGLISTRLVWVTTQNDANATAGTLYFKIINAYERVTYQFLNNFGTTPAASYTPLISALPAGTQTAAKTTLEQEPWITVSSYTSNNWQAYDANGYPVRYCKDALGIVHLDGIIKAGTGANPGATGYPFFSLPAGYLPSKSIYCAGTIYPSAFGYAVAITVGGDGPVTPNFGSSISPLTGAQWISISGISFPTQ